jgi:hypothetical protein
MNRNVSGIPSSLWCAGALQAMPARGARSSPRDYTPTRGPEGSWMVSGSGDRTAHPHPRWPLAVLIGGSRTRSTTTDADARATAVRTRVEWRMVGSTAGTLA